MGLFSLVILDLILHLVWDIIEDRITFVRKIVHQNVINEATDLLIEEIGKIRPSLKRKMEEIQNNEKNTKEEPNPSMIPK
jgi:predicted ATP-grasp superfamily ATP-dependent carboligase